MSKLVVLVVDDETSLRNFVRRNLEARGYKVFTAANGLEALGIFNNETIEMVIMDVMMPSMDGLETIRRIRQISTVPVIVLSALGEEHDKIQALNLGADDYLTKPFGVGELLARVKAVQRRSHWVSAENRLEHEQIVRGEIVVDLQGHRIMVRGEKVEFTPTEYNLLVFLMENAGRSLTHEAILRRIWGIEYGHEAEYLRVYIGRIRQKVELDPANPQYIKTAFGYGYYFKGR